MRHAFWLLLALALLALGWRAWSDGRQGGGQPTHAPAVAEQASRQPAGPSVPLPAPPLPGFDTTMTRGAIPGYLPTEARVTLQRIRNGGPYAYRRDGSVFQNRERRLPEQPEGYYREFTVETPGARDRGARRIVTGGDPPVEFYYTEDHYRSFRRFTLAAGALQ